MTKPAGQEAQATQVPPAAAAVDDPFGLSPWLKEMPQVAIPPLMAHPVAAMAAVTAIGFGLTSQIAGAVIGAMQGSAERMKAVLDEAAKADGRTAEPGRVGRQEAAAPVAEAKKTAGADTRPAMAKLKRPATVRKGSGSRAGKTDDLKAISGVGPKLEQALNGKGIFRFADIGRWTSAEVEKFEAELGLDGRIARDGWVEQARALAKAKG
ncbi:NADH-quinone oxidoreductase subunit E [Rhizobium azooxidifex]|uniref:NADH-quinone oxidoreductase subunit E n=1 Tax=Mycoplana azooxidifex TaxID=1636188 RepID=A0A7W6DF94_9HYPH|nr:NADH:ubiquinone oxidoreductase [Mycoplana azooxidifex]MBB3977924.1 NADH-quinone oxidoreductase subunit E [Mycoplana azooxidifex]